MGATTTVACTFCDADHPTSALPALSIFDTDFDFAVVLRCIDTATAIENVESFWLLAGISEPATRIT